jgi:hypothetical protein
MVTSTSTPGSKLMLVWDTRIGPQAKGGWEKKGTHDLLDNLARGMEVNQTLVDFEFVTIPGLGSLTTRLEREKRALVILRAHRSNETCRLAGGDLEDFGGETNGALHAKLLILGAVDQVIRNCFAINHLDRDKARRETYIFRDF